MRTGAAGLAPRRGELPVLEILLRAQDREIEGCQFDPLDLVSGDRSTFRIGIGECVRVPGY